MFNFLKTAKKMATEKKMVTAQKFKPVFTTIDGDTHIGSGYNYGIAERFRCSIPEFIMIDVKDDGYLKDDKNVMYPLANIISIDWKLEDEKKVEDKFGDFTLFVTKKEMEKYS